MNRTEGKISKMKQTEREKDLKISKTKQTVIEVVVCGQQSES